MPNDSNEPQNTVTPPQTPPQPSAPFQPLPPVEQTPVNQLTPPVAGVIEPTPEPKKSKKKWLFIAAGAVLLAALLVGGYFGLKASADNAATTYARNIDTQLDEIFAKSSRTERLELMKKDRVELENVFLGSVVSPTYKNADENLAPLYNNLMDMAIVATQAARDNTESLSSVLRALQNAITSKSPETYSNKDGLNAEQIGDSIENSFEVADKLDAAADQLAQATSLKEFPSYQAAINKTHEWASVRREIATFSAQWVSDVVDWGSTEFEKINESLKNPSSRSEAESFNTASYQAKMNELTAQYKTASNEAMTAFSDLVDEKLAAGQNEKTQALLDDANKKLDELDKKLEEFVPAEELKNE